MTFHRFLAPLAAWVCFSAPATAADGKVLPGTTCTATTSTSQAALVYTFDGAVVNSTSSASVGVNCPIIKDNIAATGNTTVDVSYWSNTNSTQCRVESHDIASVNVLQTNFQATGTTGYGTINFGGNFPLYNGGAMKVYCNLAGTVSGTTYVKAIRVDEP